jgi:hypothetical protein
VATGVGGRLIFFVSFLSTLPSILISALLMFLGSSDARIWLSEDWETVRYFRGYCHHLYWNLAKDPIHTSNDDTNAQRDA